jgi:acetyl/propionyl-CoA carboxylase alpha subunit
VIRTLLVANRGEIALRVVRAARELGIRTAAVFADDDARAAHVEEADIAIPLAGESPRETYLAPNAMIAAARQARADALHPGYGFLSESDAFASAVRDAGIVFVGPSPEAMAAVGSKTAAKRIAENAGVPTIPWTDGAALDGKALAKAAAAIGYPLLVKASAGGGGRGMRIVEREADLAAAVAAARAEASAAFGDGAIFLEKLLVSPRHIEVQILGDAAGHVVHLFERECSIQRRHQKLVEEAPSPFASRELRERLTSAAVAIARATGYSNAGTVEFLVEPDGTFYFIEVNARLQVEHPVTEAITGVDLVAWQLRIAGGEALALRQDEIVPRGHAIECRLIAEDAANGFVPASGAVRRLRFPAGPGVRVDSGLREGSVISTRYDSLLAKVIAHAEDRNAAIRRMERALCESIFLGLPTNLAFLAALVSHDAFRRGDTTIDFLTRYGAELVREPSIERREIVAIALFEAMRHELDRATIGADGAAGDGAALRDPWDLVRDTRCGL